MSKLQDEVYSATKSYGIKGALLPFQIIEDLAESRNLSEMIDKLRPTIYGKTVSELSGPVDADRLELTFRKHLVELHHDLAKVSKRSEIVRAYFMKHLARNLKIVLKGKALAKGYDEIARFIDLRAEELVGRRDLIVKAYSARDLSEAVETLRDSEFGAEAEAATELYRREPDLAVFDLHIDRAFYGLVFRAYRRLPTSERGKCRPLVSVDIDGYNLLAIIRSKVWDLTSAETKKFLLDSGVDIANKTLEVMVEAANVPDVVKLLERTNYRKYFRDITVDKDLPARVENTLSLLGYRRAVMPFTHDVFGVSVVLGAIRLKELEVRNLSLIALGVEQGIGSKVIMEKLLRIS